MKNRNLKWEDRKALQQFNKTIDYVSANSIQNAIKVREQIIQKLEQLIKSPEINPPGKCKLENDGNYRAFEMYHLRISYYVSPVKISILQVRQTGMTSLYYQAKPSFTEAAFRLSICLVRTFGFT